MRYKKQHKEKFFDFCLLQLKYKNSKKLQIKLNDNYLFFY